VTTRTERPGRYIGGEPGSVTRKGEVSFTLAFPDVYEVGMSHLGLQVLYGVLKSTPWVSPERVYAPWPDREEELRATSRRLETLESNIPLDRTDILGFTLQYELSYTNILNMMDLGGIPLLAEDRREGSYPLIIAGGPCALNPEPLAPFFDAFLLGDGEEAIVEIAATVRKSKRDGMSRKELLAELAEIEGIYVPSQFEVTYAGTGEIFAVTRIAGRPGPVRRRILADIENAPYPTEPVVPFLKTVHDRVSIEVARGCTRGCRFCQAGYIYRPVRERSPEKILALVQETLRNTGYDEISLLSLSTGDYGCILPLLQLLMERYARERVAVSLPSLRVGTLTNELVEEVRRVRKTGFTLAPEAGTERLRRAINKGITEEDLLASAFDVYRAGWRVIKLYFMIGLPGETAEDVAGIAELARKVKTEGKRSGRGGEVNVAVSTFVPKPHTPFQWEPQIGFDEIVAKQRFLKDELKKRKLNFKWHEPRLSLLEGVFARGDRRLAKVLVEAHRLGCRFDGWGEHFDQRKWDEAFETAGVDPAFYRRGRSSSEILPWDHLDSGIPKSYFERERERARELAATPDCRGGACSGCGVCSGETRMRIATKAGLPSPAETLPPESDGREKVRLRFRKRGRMATLGHLELVTLFTRSVRRAGIPIRYSQGFHPHPKFSFAGALSLGVESDAEYVDLEIAPGFGAERVMETLNGVLPEGLEVVEAAALPPSAPSLSVVIEASRYRVTLPKAREDLPAQAARFMSSASFPILRRKEREPDREIDARAETLFLTATADTLEMVLRRIKPSEVAAAVAGVPETELGRIRIEKLDVLFAAAATGAGDTTENPSGESAGETEVVHG
jgi:radical SAM family uncharacterized protein/radical SAM-linked protein